MHICVRAVLYVMNVYLKIFGLAFSPKIQCSVSQSPKLKWQLALPTYFNRCFIYTYRYCDGTE